MTATVPHIYDMFIHFFRCSLGSRVFPKAKISLVCTESSMGSKFYFSQWKTNFSQFIFIDEYLKFKEIKWFIHYIKSEM